jgi:hypothetical protein
MYPVSIARSVPPTDAIRVSSSRAPSSISLVSF